MKQEYYHSSLKAANMRLESENPAKKANSTKSLLLDDMILLMTSIQVYSQSGNRSRNAKAFFISSLIYNVIRKKKKTGLGTGNMPVALVV